MKQPYITKKRFFLVIIIENYVFVYIIYFILVYVIKKKHI